MPKTVVENERVLVPRTTFSLTACLPGLLDSHIDADMHFVTFDNPYKNIRPCLAVLVDYPDYIPNPTFLSQPCLFQRP